LTTGEKRRADRLPLSDPPLTFFITPNLPLSGRKIVENQLIGRGIKPSVSSIIGFCPKFLNFVLASGRYLKKTSDKLRFFEFQHNVTMQWNPESRIQE
jgi:hypothetical protein